MRPCPKLPMISGPLKTGFSDVVMSLALRALAFLATMSSSARSSCALLKLS